MKPDAVSPLPALLILFMGFFFANMPHPSAEDWPLFLGPRQNGHSAETNLVDRFPEAGLPEIWAKSVGVGYSAPSIQGTNLILHHRVGNEEIVECLDKATGQTKWKYPYPTGFIDPFGYNNGPRCSPQIIGGTIYTFGAEGVLTALELTTGKKLWQIKTAEKWTVPQAFFGVGSTPIYHQGSLIVQIGGQENAGVVCFDATTGKVQWEAVGKKTWDGTPKLDWPGEPLVVWKGWEKLASYASPVIKKINGTDVLFCVMRQGLVGLNPETGETKFTRWFRARVNESVNAMNPVVNGDYVLLSSAYYRQGSVLLKISKDLSSLEQIWRNRSLEIHWTTPILHEGHLYAFSGRNEPDASFRCVEYLTGKVKWERDESWYKRTKTPDKYGRGSAILADEKLFVLGEGGLLGLFDPIPTAPVEHSRWQVPRLTYPCWTAPILSDKRLYLRNEKWLIALNVSARGH